MKGRRGSILLALMVTSIALIMVIGQLARQPEQRKALRSAQQLAQARQLAEAGLEGTRLRLLKDIEFPEFSSDRLQTFTFVEEVRAPSLAQRAGWYRVTVQSRWQNPPYSILEVTSEGLLGSPDQSMPNFRIRTRFDLAERRQGMPNDRFWQWVEWNEGGR